jgi:hypothetical protein
MLTNSKPTPNSICQNNLTFISAYNLKDPPKLLFKRWADYQEVAIVAKVLYTSKQLLVNVVDLLMGLGIYARNMDNWECKAKANKPMSTSAQASKSRISVALHLASSLPCRAATPPIIVLPVSPPTRMSRTTARPTPSSSQSPHTWQIFLRLSFSRPPQQAMRILQSSTP